MLVRTVLTVALAAAVSLEFTPPATACPACGPPSGQTLTSEVAQADFILFGTLGNQKADPKDPGSSKGTTDMTIDAVVKSHELVKDKKVYVIRGSFRRTRSLTSTSCFSTSSTAT